MSISFMWRELLRYPVTMGLVVGCSILFVLTLPWGVLPFQTHAEGLRYFGACIDLQNPQQPEIHGPFDLWRGEWWRIPISGFHHVNLWHLFFNLTALRELGRLFEDRWGAGRWFLFLLMGVLVSMPGELLMGACPIGISGALCAAFGAIFVLAKHDAQLAKRWPPNRIQFVIGSLIVMAILTQLNILPIANIAHFTGLFWGMAVAWVGTDTSRSRTVSRTAFVIAHCGLIPVYWYLVHPTYSKEYQFWKAAQVSVSFFEGEMQAPGGHIAVWKTALVALEKDRANPLLLRIVRSMWWQLAVSPQRDEALNEVRNVFQEEAPIWEEFLHRDPFRPLPPELSPVKIRPQEPLPDYSLDRSLDLTLPNLGAPAGQNLLDAPLPSTSPLKLPNPDREDSAVEGRAL